MGTTGYQRAANYSYREDEIILEVGVGESTRYLAEIGPPVVTIDVDPNACDSVEGIWNVEVYCGRAEDVLRDWPYSIGFAWLDGYDWPYSGATPGYFADQQAAYESNGFEYSCEASRDSHLTIARLIADKTRVVAFDDTWRTHAYVDVGAQCGVSVPPATEPAFEPALNQPTGATYCGLYPVHPHHNEPGRGWDGKGGTAIPYLLTRGFEVTYYGLALAVLERKENRSE